MNDSTAEHRSRLVGTALLAVAVLASTAACDLGHGAAADPASTFTSDGTPTDPAGALAALDTLRIAPEDTGVHYRREDWKHWISQPSFGKGCDTREMILVQQGRHTGGGQIQRDPSTCAPYRGHGNTWTSPYDNVTTSRPDDLDIDHIVPLEQMARSGTRSWTPAQRQAYANDPQILLAVTKSTNRKKGSQDPAKWMPDQHKCDYLGLWVAAKKKYGATVDQDEHDAIASGLRRCK